MLFRATLRDSSLKRGGKGGGAVCEGEAAHDAFWDRWNTGLESIGEGRRADASP